LKSDCVSYYPQGGRTPDLWGVDLSTRNSYLVEAKGTSGYSYFFEKGILKDAIEQLNSISHVEFIAGTRSRRFSGTELKKIAIGSHPNKVGEVTQQVIDPTEGEDLAVEIHGSDLVKEYYKKIIKIIELYPNEIYHINGLEVIGVYIEKVSLNIGVLKPLYDMLKSEGIEESIYAQVNSILDEYDLDESLETNSYVGLDGIYIKSYN